MKLKAYLAGPEVFLPDAVEIGQRKVAICARHGIEGLYPLDAALDLTGLSKPLAADAIFRANREAMRRADLLIANMTPFRGLSMDPGTAFEMGFMCALEKPVLAYTNKAGSYLIRALEAGLCRGGLDPDGLAVEDFDLADNLMMACAVRACGFEVLARGEGQLSGAALIAELSMFEACVACTSRH